MMRATVGWFFGVALVGGVACGGSEFGSAGAGGASGGGGSDASGGSDVSGRAGSVNEGGARCEGGSAPRAGTSGGGSDGLGGGSGGVGGSLVLPDPGDAGAGGMPDDAPPVNECPCAAPRPTCEAGRCLSRGPSMVKSGSFYVDSTEVTVAQYALFVAAKGDDTSGQAPQCAWNDSFAPAVKGQAPHYPVTHVDFCDAAAYCAWADKQLCGKIGGGTLAFADLASATKSQWFAACGGSKGQPYPYGSSYQAGACNSSTGKLTEVGALDGCEGFQEGVFDMVGNVAEWVNACDAAQGAVDGCETIGGHYAQSGTCSLSALKHRDEQLPTVGFRCCSP